MVASGGPAHLAIHTEVQGADRIQQRFVGDVGGIERRQVDRVKQPKCSLFTLGLRWINQLLNRDELPEVVLVPEL